MDKTKPYSFSLTDEQIRFVDYICKVYDVSRSKLIRSLINVYKKQCIEELGIDFESWEVVNNGQEQKSIRS